MKKTSLIIGGGILGTFLVLGGLISIMYFSSGYSTNRSTTKNKTEENKEVIKEEENTTTDTITEEENKIEENISTLNEVTLYLFHGSTCPYCLKAKDFLNTIKEQYPYLKIETYEVWHNENNKTLMKKVGEKLGLEVKSVPFIVVADNYKNTGYSSSRDAEIKEAIEKNYHNVNYKDIVLEVSKELNLEVVSEEL